MSDLARAADLIGWVRNREDGGVELVAQGGRTEVTALLNGLREGPPWAAVDRVEVSWEEPAPNLTGFRVVS